jgi:hypothetical protein
MPRAPALPSFPPNDTLTGSPLQTAPYFYYSRRNGTGDGARCTQPLIAQFRRRSILIGGTRRAPNACDPSYLDVAIPTRKHYNATTPTRVYYRNINTLSLSLQPPLCRTLVHPCVSPI